MGDAARERIVRSARPLFLSNGYRNTTVEEIARAAGMSTRTIYENFASKREIAEAMVDIELKTFRERIHQITVSSKEPLEKFRDFYDYSLEILNPGLSAAALKDLEQELPDLWEEVTTMQEQVLGELRRVIEDGKKKGIFRRDLSTDVFIAGLTGALQATMSADFLINSSISLKEVYSNLFELFTNGICVR